MTLHLHLPITLAPNRDSVKPKPQLCMNQNNNPQRFLLPPFPDTLCDSFSAESSTRENPLRLISSPDTPTCRGVTAGCPGTASQPELMTECVCVSATKARCPGRLQRSMRTGERLWAPGVMLWCCQLPNRLCCPVEDDLRSLSTVMLKSQGLRLGCTNENSFLNLIKSGFNFKLCCTKLA